MLTGFGGFVYGLMKSNKDKRMNDKLSNENFEIRSTNLGWLVRTLKFVSKNYKNLPEMRSVAKKILGVLLPWWWPPYSFLSFRVFKIIVSCRVHLLLRHDFLILYWGFLSYLSHVTVSLSCIDLLVVLWVINFWLRQRRRFLLILKLIVHFYFFLQLCVCVCVFILTFLLLYIYLFVIFNNLFY